MAKKMFSEITICEQLQIFKELMKRRNEVTWCTIPEIKKN